MINRTTMAVWKLAKSLAGPSFRSCLCASLKCEVKLLSRCQRHRVCQYASVPLAPSDSTDVDSGEEKILQYLNTFTAEEMRQKKHLTFTVSEEICKHRAEHGPFKSVDDLNKVRKIGPKTFQSLCERLKTDAPEEKQRKNTEEMSLLKFISPAVSTAFLQSVTSVTSMEVCSDGVYYSNISRDNHLLDWSHVPLKAPVDLRQSPSQILEEAFRVVEKLPVSSIYIMEHRPLRKISQTYIHLLMFIGRLQMAIQTLLNKDLQTVGRHKVFHVKDTFAISVFDLRVGGERVSGQHIIKQIQDGQYSGNFVISSEFWDHYDNLDSPAMMERYANSLLVNMAFCQNILSK